MAHDKDRSPDPSPEALARQPDATRGEVDADATRQRLERLEREHPASYADLERRFQQVRARQEAAELQRFERNINLVEYARGAGYQRSGRPVSCDVNVLEHHQTKDRIAVHQTPKGRWIFASVCDFKPRGDDGERGEHARERLGDSIRRTRDQGGIVDFVHYRERMAGRADVTPDRVREHLRAWMEERLELERLPRASADLEHTYRLAHAALNQRIGDWAPSPAPLDPSASEVQDRLRRWQDAQRAIDLKLARATELAKPPQGPPLLPGIAGAGASDKALSPRELSRGQGDALAPNTPQHPLSQRRYDWTPPVSAENAKGLGRALPGRGSDRGR